jgi:glyoxylase-like metal-dependent hydrolase (beta-lactamase superfamily II)
MVPLKIDTLLPGVSFGTDSGTPAFCSVLLIEGEKRVLVDTAHVGRRTVIEAGLQERGLTPDDIDLVILTHAHWDHVQNIDLFRNARILVHPDERRYSHRPHRNDWATPQWTGVMLETMPLFEAGEGYQVMPGMTIMDAPGHSPGSIGVVVETAQGKAVITGDAMHNAGIALSGQNPLVFWDAEQANRSIARMVQEADLLYPGHDRAFRLRDGEVEYVEPFRLALTNLSLEMEGLRFVPNPPRQVWIMPGIEEQRVVSGE